MVETECAQPSSQSVGGRDDVFRPLCQNRRRNKEGLLELARTWTRRCCAGNGSRPNLDSVLQEGRKSTNIPVIGRCTRTDRVRCCRARSCRDDPLLVLDSNLTVRFARSAHVRKAQDVDSSGAWIEQSRDRAKINAATRPGTPQLNSRGDGCGQFCTDATRKSDSTIFRLPAEAPSAEAPCRPRPTVGAGVASYLLETNGRRRSE
jgi:hypothetical protein